MKLLFSIWIFFLSVSSLAAESLPYPGFVEGDSLNCRKFKGSNTWKTRKYFPNYDYFIGLLGIKYELFERDNTLPTIHHDTSIVIPESFDSRQKWPRCKSISVIRDQGNCGACWACSSAAVMSDRVCIHSGETIQVTLSDAELLACCSKARGCAGTTSLEYPWKYWIKHGLVTGGSWNSQEGCMPSVIPHCKKKCPASATPSCVKQCAPGYPLSFKADKVYGKRAYHVAKSEIQIQLEIMKNGPVTAGYKVYEDFYCYSHGIYKHVWGDNVGGHAIKILGWGVENGTKYWLCANSWNATWGENGYFRIERGVDDSGIENDIDGGIPELHNKPNRYYEMV